MKTMIKRGCFISFILLLIALIVWGDYSFLFIGLSIVNVGIMLLLVINDTSNQKK